MTRALALATLVLAGHIYPSTAQKLAPTQTEVGFKTVAAFQKAKKPTGAAATGYKTGVAILYSKGTTKNPTSALATIYVYRSAADAAKAWTAACKKCSTQSAPSGIKLKAAAGQSNGLFALQEITRCSNVYLNVVEQSSASVTAIDTDVAKITNAVFARAIHFGLSSCTAK